MSESTQEHSETSAQCSEPALHAEQMSFEETSSNFWFAMAKWSREGNHFNSFVRRFIYNIGMYKSTGKELSEKQLAWGVKILTDSCALGFTHEDSPTQ